MNAEALLKAYGWSGSGSLDSHNGADSRGLSKPLLISKKVDVLGVGLNKHAAVSDQWWMRAYDSGLKDLGTGKKSTLSEIREKGMFAGGLYGRFVKGESEGGTIQQWNQQKRKREDEDSGYESKGKRVKTEGERKVKQNVRRRVKAFLDEAKSRNLLEGDLKASAKRQPIVAIYGEDAVLTVFKEAGLDDSGPSKSSGKQQKYFKEKQKRQLEKAAKAFVISQLSAEERAELQSGDSKREGKRDEKRKAKALAATERAAEKAAAKEAKEARKQQDLEMKAWEKGVTVEQYLQQRKAKKSAKTKESLEISPTATETPAFSVDTTGDSTLAAKANQVVDAAGNVRYTMVSEIPVPLDPTIWEGINVKKLPKRVREARRKWMESKRQARKAAGGSESQTSKHKQKPKEGTKIARQEALVLEILGKSRKAKKDTKTATIDGIDNVTLVAVTSKEPNHFTKEEMARARTIARKVLKEQKKKGKDGKE